MSAAEINVRILLALVVVIGASRLAGWAISKIGQPRVHGEILAAEYGEAPKAKKAAAVKEEVK